MLCAKTAVLPSFLASTILSSAFVFLLLKVKVVIPYISRLLYHEDQHILGDVCTIIALLTDTKKGIQAWVDAGVSRRLIELLRYVSCAH